MPFYEPGLQDLVSRSLRAGRLAFADPEGEMSLVGEPEVLLIAVNTPHSRADGSADLSSVGAVARGTDRALGETDRRRQRPLVVANKSTVPSNPEFSKEGCGVYDSLRVPYEPIIDRLPENVAHILEDEADFEYVDHDVSSHTNVPHAP